VANHHERNGFPPDGLPGDGRPRWRGKRKHFLGGSHVVSPEGEIISQLPLFEEALVQVRLNGRALEETRKKRPLLRNERVSLYGRVFKKLGTAAEKGGKGDK